MKENLIESKALLSQIEGLLTELEALQSLLKNKNDEAFESKGHSLLDLLQDVYEKVSHIKEKIPSLAAPIMCECIIESLKYVLSLARQHPQKAEKKIEFEVIPLTEELYTHCYFKIYVGEDKSRKRQFLTLEKPKFYRNKYLEKAKETGEYTYELSIIVVAYNKLEVTKLCVESLLKYVPKDLNYELILLNHGSVDGTKEYFESIAPTKQLDLYKNGGGMHAVHRIVEGKYQLIISNDVLVTENAISNMLACIKSDEKIKWVVPATPNISNLQSITANYTNLEEMYAFAKANNVLDPRRWEQRARLCDPIAMSENVWDILTQTPYFDNWLGFSFPDDRTSLALRRKGYQMMLAKDAYCYHFGSLTLKSEIDEYKSDEGGGGSYNFYLEGRKKFEKECGIDPWGVGFCWSFELISLLPWERKEEMHILGINCGIGSNPLKVKTYLKELGKSDDAVLYNVTDDLRYMRDLQGVSDKVQYVHQLKQLPKVLQGMKFDYIIFEDRLEQYKDPQGLITQMTRQLLKPEGAFAFNCSQQKLLQSIRSKYPGLKSLGNWHSLIGCDRA